MSQIKILVVDEERNIRLALAEALKPLGHAVETALNGEEAMRRLHDPAIRLLLELRLPGMDGLQVLRRVGLERPEVAVIVITAHGTVELAVEAMKLGAVDFIAKPFSPQDIRELATRVLDRQRLAEPDARDYRVRLELAKQGIRERNFAAALEHARRAVGQDPYRAEGFNLVGALHEILHDRSEALKNYRLAVEVDPTFAPAQANLDRLVSHKGQGQIAWDDDIQRPGR
ncbi:MAG: response regulator [Thermodesulfobacteriota bacterium]